MRSRPLVFMASTLLVVACAQSVPEREEQARAEPPPRTDSAAAGAEAPLAGSPAVENDGMRDAPLREGPLQMQLKKAESGRAKAEASESFAPMPAAPMASVDALGAGRYAPMIQDRETYQHFDESAVLRVAEQPVSTFSIDVDTGAYSNLRRFLKGGSLPRQDAVRVEEMINYFDYAYAPPSGTDAPFAVHAEMAPTPWNAKTELLRIGVQGWKPSGPMPPSNLVFLVDVSGSMADTDKLPLVKSSLRLLVNELTARDRISLVVYAGASGVVLEPTSGDQKAKILAAIDHLDAGGSTNGAEGIRLAYAMAEGAYLKNGINRVLLATDGDFNVGTVNFEQLKDLIEEKRKSGVALSTLGFGTGNYNDQLMEQLADAGNGNYTYVDGLTEARRALVQMRAATLQTIAKDVKIQVEFNPAAVTEYRLIGYENRALKREDFNNDQVDAGEIGAGHSVTALYEVALKGSGGERVDPLRYGAGDAPEANPREIAFLRLRYKRPDGDTSRLIERPITRADRVGSMDAASESLRFAAAVSAFGQILRGGRYTERFGYEDVLKLARAARGADAQGWRSEFVQLVGLAESLGTHAGAERTEGRD